MREHRSGDDRTIAIATALLIFAAVVVAGSSLTFGIVAVLKVQLSDAVFGGLLVVALVVALRHLIRFERR